MKIAFVSQPIDVVLPPFQNSVGACTYGAACALAGSNDVTVYGLEQPKQAGPEVLHRDVRFCFLPSSSSDRLLHKLRNKLSKLVQMSTPISTSRLFYPNYGRQVAQELANGQFDVIHIQHAVRYVPAIRRLNPKSKIVLHLHAEWFSQSKPSKLAKQLKELDLLTAVSDHITHKTQTQAAALADRCKTVYNGINDHEFSTGRDYSAFEHRRLKRIMYAGGVSPHKGIHVLLDAFQIVAECYPDVRLEIIGPPGSYPLEETFELQDRALIEEITPFYRKGLAALVQRKLSGDRGGSDTYPAHLRSRMSAGVADKVEFLGLIPRPELVQRYYDTDIFVFPPIWDEGFGIPPVEAMAAGAAVVASRSGGVAETVVHGETGLLVEKNDPQALAKAILVLLSDDAMRERMGRAGQRRVMEQFTWNRVAEKMERNYQLLCSRSLARCESADEKQRRLNIFRSFWLAGLMAVALTPWIVKFPMGINGVHHDAWHLISFFLTALVLSDLVRSHGHGQSRSLVRGRVLQSLIAVLAALFSEILEVLLYHRRFEWRDVMMDCAGIALGCALSWRVPVVSLAFSRIVGTVPAKHKH
jgi:glycosyltransferase involved in cell wall biosynthesis